MLLPILFRTSDNLYSESILWAKQGHVSKVYCSSSLCTVTKAGSHDDNLYLEISFCIIIGKILGNLKQTHSYLLHGWGMTAHCKDKSMLWKKRGYKTLVCKYVNIMVSLAREALFCLLGVFSQFLRNLLTQLPSCLICSDS